MVWSLLFSELKLASYIFNAGDICSLSRASTGMQWVSHHARSVALLKRTAFHCSLLLAYGRSSNMVFVKSYCGSFFKLKTTPPPAALARGVDLRVWELVLQPK